MSNTSPQRILFVCLGNICRSPVAEAVLASRIESLGLHEAFEVDSAGTSAVHSGERADPRMIQAASQLGFPMTSISRQFDPHSDFSSFDRIYCMDLSNLRNVHAMASNQNDREKVMLLSELSDAIPKEIPDPYYGGQSGFTDVIRMMEVACDALVNLRSNKS